MYESKPIMNTKQILKSGSRFLAYFFMLIMVTNPTTFAQNTSTNPQSLQKIDVNEHLGETIPLDLQFTDHNGEQVTLEKYFNQDKPVLLTMVYYDCPMLCTLVLNGLKASVDSLDWTPGEEYQIVAVSIDPRETPELAAQKHDAYIESMQKEIDGESWAFLVGEESQSRALAEALGFQYYWVEENEIYAHPAVSYVLTDEGKITRYLYGLDHKKRDLRLALVEGGQGKVGNTADKLLLYCYQYDPDSEGYVLFAENLMKLGGALTVVILGSVVGTFWWRETHNKSTREQETQEQ